MALIEQTPELIIPDYFEAEDMDGSSFFEFSLNFWNNHYDTTPDHRYGTVAEVAGVPTELVPVDGFKLELEKTTLSLDLSERHLGRFGWRVDSQGFSSVIRRLVTVDDEELAGSIDRRETKSVRSDVRELDDISLRGLIAVVRQLAVVARKDPALRLPLQAA